MAMGRVTKRARDLDCNPLVTDNENHIFNTCQYIAEFAYGDESEIAANVITSNMYAH